MSGPCRKDLALTATAVMVAVVLISLSAAAENAGTPDLATMVNRITQAQKDNLDHKNAYSLTREYKIFGGDAVQPRTSVLARVNFLPPNVKTYDIDQSTGGVGEKVVRHILDHEVDATRNPQHMLISDENYKFDFAGEDAIAGNPCYKLNITPRHERKDLLKATLWVDKDTYQIVRMEGEPAKSPSFWVKDVHLVLDYSQVAGMWLQTETHAVARMRFGGDYKIVSQNVNYDLAQTVAVNTHPPRRRRASALMAAAVR